MCPTVNSIFMVFLMSASVVVIHSTPLTCQNIYNDTVSLSKCGIGKVLTVDKVEYMEIKCSQFDRNNGTGLIFTFRILENTTVNSEKDKFVYCVGFETVSSYHMIQSRSFTNRNRIILKDDDEDVIKMDPYISVEEEDEDDDDDADNVANKRWSFEFNDKIATGSIVVHKTCIIVNTTAPTCTTEVRLMSNIFNMPMFHYKIIKKEFWNFTDPLFDADEEWLRTLVTSGYKYDLRFLRALGNTSLQELKISDNLDFTDQVFLGEMPRLKKFHFQHGYLSTFDSGNCKGKRSLTEISFMNNMLHEIPPHGLSSCQELKILDLSGQDSTVVTIINKEELRSILKLEELNLSRVKINTFEKDFLPPLPNLKSLNLSSCEIQNISGPEPFNIFPKLKILDLSLNYIQYLDKLFIKSSNLQVLNISGNSEMQLSNLSIINQDLKILDLSQVGLMHFPPLNSCKIKVLKLAMNSFKTIENLSENNVTVHCLDLSYSTELKEWADKNIFKNKQFQNISKYDFIKSRSWVNVLNLTGTPIDDFTEDMILSMQFLSEVDLQGIHISCDSCASPFIKWVNADRTTKILHLKSERPLLMCADKDRTTIQKYSEECPHGAAGNLILINQLLIFTLILSATKIK